MGRKKKTSSFFVVSWFNKVTKNLFFNSQQVKPQIEKNSVTSNDSLIIRKFVVLAPESQDPHPKHWEDFNHHSVIVILGDPGMGKTTFLNSKAKQEKNAICLSFRKLLCENSNNLYGKSIFIDGLDEYRAVSGRGELAPDELVKFLQPFKGQQFCIGCRIADWNINQDTSILETIATNEDVVVVKLVPLSEEDIIIISNEYGVNGQVFYEKACTLDLHQFIANPLNLIMLIKAFAKSGEWPESKIELYEKICTQMVKEENERHPYPKSPSRLLEAAGELMAFYVISNLEGFSKHSGQTKESVHFYAEISSENYPAVDALETRLFTSHSSNVFEPIHKSYAEFLASKYLTNLIRDGLPISRVLSLITGFDGRFPPSLRGLAGWLASMLPEYARIIINRDPLGILTYGDISTFPVDSKIAFLDTIRDACLQPAFPTEWIEGETCAPLSSSDIQPEYEKILGNEKEPWFLHRIILWSLEHGFIVHKTSPILIKYINNSNTDSFNKYIALKALIKITKNSIKTLIEILDSINSNIISDEDKQLRGALTQLSLPKPHRTKRYFDLHG